METIPDGFEKILIGNIRGLAGTIEPGTITLTAPGTDPSVTNSGTDTEAVFDFKLPRFELEPRAIYDEAVEDGFTGTFDDWQHEYLGGLISPDLPWCEGYYQNTSLAAGVAVFTVPIVVRGDTSMVSGNTFVANESGIYSCTAGGGLMYADGMIMTMLIRNGLNGNAGGVGGDDELLAQNIAPTGTHQTTTSWTGWMESGDYITTKVSSTVAQSGMNRAGRTMKFRFVQLSQEAT